MNKLPNEEQVQLLPLAGLPQPDPNQIFTALGFERLKKTSKPPKDSK